MSSRSASRNVCAPARRCASASNFGRDRRAGEFQKQSWTCLSLCFQEFVPLTVFCTRVCHSEKFKSGPRCKHFTVWNTALVCMYGGQRPLAWCTFLQVSLSGPCTRETHVRAPHPSLQTRGVPRLALCASCYGNVFIARAGQWATLYFDAMDTAASQDLWR